MLMLRLVLVALCLLSAVLGKTRRNPFAQLLRRSRTDVKVDGELRVEPASRTKRRVDGRIRAKDEVKLDIPFDDYGGVGEGARRGMGRRPPRAVCLFTTKTLLDIVTITRIVLPLHPPHYLRFVLGGERCHRTPYPV